MIIILFKYNIFILLSPNVFKIASVSIFLKIFFLYTVKTYYSELVLKHRCSQSRVYVFRGRETFLASTPADRFCTIVNVNLNSFYEFGNTVLFSNNQNVRGTVEISRGAMDPQALPDVRP